MYEIKFSKRAKHDLDKLTHDVGQRIIKKLTFFKEQKNPLQFAKPLVNLPPATHRFRVGDYRIAFHISVHTIFIDKIANRREVYL